MAQPMQAQPTQSAPTQQPLPQSQSAPVMATRQFPQTTAPSVKPAQPAMASSMMSAPQADITEFHELFAQLVGNVSQVVVGKEQPIRQCATAMIVGGHILLEDNPGTGKTQLARGLANSIDTARLCQQTRRLGLDLRLSTTEWASSGESMVELGGERSRRPDFCAHQQPQWHAVGLSSLPGGL